MIVVDSQAKLAAFGVLMFLIGVVFGSLLTR